MKNYFKKLKSHPGVPLAAFMTVLFVLAGATNKSFSIPAGMLFGLVGLLLIWIIVLISNFERK